MGTHVIEAGFPVNSDAEFEAVRDIASSTSTTTCGLARVVDKDIEAALDSGVEMVHTFVSTSDVQIEDSMHATRDEVVQRAVESVERIKDAGAICMFSPMDATRTDEQFLMKVIEEVTEAGTDWINIPDTCGVATPGRFRAMIEKVSARTDAGSTSTPTTTSAWPPRTRWPASKRCRPSAGVSQLDRRTRGQRRLRGVRDVRRIALPV